MEVLPVYYITMFTPNVLEVAEKISNNFLTSVITFVPNLVKAVHAAVTEIEDEDKADKVATPAMVAVSVNSIEIQGRIAALSLEISKHARERERYLAKDDQDEYTVLHIRELTDNIDEDQSIILGLRQFGKWFKKY